MNSNRSLWKQAKIIGIAMTILLVVLLILLNLPDIRFAQFNATTEMTYLDATGILPFSLISGSQQKMNVKLLRDLYKRVLLFNNTNGQTYTFSDSSSLPIELQDKPNRSTVSLGEYLQFLYHLPAFVEGERPAVSGEEELLQLFIQNQVIVQTDTERLSDVVTVERCASLLYTYLNAFSPCFYYGSTLESLDEFITEAVMNQNLNLFVNIEERYSEEDVLNIIRAAAMRTGMVYKHTYNLLDGESRIILILSFTYSLDPIPDPILG